MLWLVSRLCGGGSARNCFLHGPNKEKGWSNPALLLFYAPTAARALALHRWLGNVREVQNRVRRAVIMADGKRLTAKDLELTDTLTALPPPPSTSA